MPASADVLPASEGTQHPTQVVVCGDLNLLRCFARTGIRTLVASAEPDSVTFHSRYCGEARVIADPKAAPDRALADLLELGARLTRLPMLVYGDDAMLLLVSRHRTELSRYYRLLLPSEELIEILVDKVRFAARARQLGIQAPGTVTSWDTESADDVLARLSLPVILKPAVHVGWHQFQRQQLPGRRPSKALLAETEADLRLFYGAIRAFTSNFVVQEYIPGGSADHYSVHVWLDEQSKPLGYFAGRKIRTYPKESGHSTCLELVENQELVDLGLDIVARLELRGPAKLDFKRDPRTGRFYLLEINPRYNLWHDLGARAGVNLPLLGYQYLSGVRPELSNKWNTRYKWIAFGDDLRAAVRYYLPDGDLTWKDLLGSYIGPRVYEVFSWRDPGPWAVHMARSLRPGTMMHALRRYFGHSRQPGSSHSSP